MARAPKKIRTPLKQRWRQIRYRFLPIVVFSSTVLATIVLWQNQAGPSGLRGRAAARSATITAPLAARILPLPGGATVELDSVVTKGQLIVIFDTAIIDHQIEAAAIELLRREKEKDLIEQEFETAKQEEVRDIGDARIRIDAELADLHAERRDRNARIVDQESRIKAAEAEKLIVEEVARELDILDKTLKNAELNRRGVTVTAKRLEANKWQVAIVEGRKTIVVLRGQIVEVERSIEKLKSNNPPRPSTARLVTALSPYVKAIDVQKNVKEQLEKQRESYEIKAPFDGKITKVLKWPSQTVEPGEMIFEISATDAEYIIAYVRQGPRNLPRIKDVVDVRLRTRPPQVGYGHVLQIGAKFELIPLEHLRDSRVPEWGYPVRIKIPKKFVDVLRPGESVDLTFTSPKLTSTTPASGDHDGDDGGLRLIVREAFQRNLGRASLIGAAQATR